MGLAQAAGSRMSDGRLCHIAVEQYKPHLGHEKCGRRAMKAGWACTPAGRVADQEGDLRPPLILCISSGGGMSKSAHRFGGLTGQKMAGWRIQTRPIPQSRQNSATDAAAVHSGYARYRPRPVKGSVQFRLRLTSWAEWHGSRRAHRLHRLFQISIRHRPRSIPR